MTWHGMAQTMLQSVDIHACIAPYGAFLQCMSSPSSLAPSPTNVCGTNFPQSFGCVMRCLRTYSYSGGIYSSSRCGTEPNHAIVIVAAGVDSDTKKPYWLLRNSWGSEWGEGEDRRGCTWFLRAAPFQHATPPQGLNLWQHA